jgi:hypothetical protein
VPPAPRRRRPSFSFARRYGCSGARVRHDEQRSVQRSSASAVGATAAPHHEQENGTRALKAPALARLGGIDRCASCCLVLVPGCIDLDVV